MNWISNVVPPKIRSLLRRDTPENLWVKCPESGQLVFHKDLEANLMVVPGSGYHMRISPKARLASLFDDGDYEEAVTPEMPSDPLRFRDIKRYADRLRKTGPGRARLTPSRWRSADFSHKTSPLQCKTLAFKADLLACRPGKQSSQAWRRPSSDGRHL